MKLLEAFKKVNPLTSKEMIRKLLEKLFYFDYTYDHRVLIRICMKITIHVLAIFRWVSIFSHFGLDRAYFAYIFRWFHLRKLMIIFSNDIHTNYRFRKSKFWFYFMCIFSSLSGLTSIFRRFFVHILKNNY